jgi:hypothetical protein
LNSLKLENNNFGLFNQLFVKQIRHEFPPGKRKVVWRFLLPLTPLLLDVFRAVYTQDAENRLGVFDGRL